MKQPKEYICESCEVSFNSNEPKHLGEWIICNECFDSTKEELWLENFSQDEIKNEGIYDK